MTTSDDAHPIARTLARWWVTKRWQVILIGGCVLALLVTLALRLGRGDEGGGEGETPSIADLRFSVVSQCEKQIKGQLKAPATARFSEETTTGPSAGQWTVDGVVDAENSFGALIRSRWSCDAQYDPDTRVITTRAGMIG